MVKRAAERAFGRLRDTRAFLINLFTNMRLRQTLDRLTWQRIAWFLIAAAAVAWGTGFVAGLIVRFAVGR